jgi:hypothetical protein
LFAGYRSSAPILADRVRGVFMMVRSPRRSMMTPSTANRDDLSMRRPQASTIWENLPESKLEVTMVG